MVGRVRYSERVFMGHKRWMITLIFILMASLAYYIATESTDFDSLFSDVTILHHDDFSPGLEAENFLTPGQRDYRYKAILNKAEFTKLGDGNYRLLIYRLADNAHEVYFNGVLIGAAGDKNKLNSNLWNGLFNYTISGGLVRSQNDLEIVTSSIYRTGLSTIPIYIVHESIAPALVSKLNFFGDRLILFSIGFMMFSSVLSLLMYSSKSEKSRVYLYIAIGSFFGGIYFVDYLVFEHIAIPYLLYKKITIGSLFFAIGLYGYAISLYFDSLIAKYAGHCLTIGTVFILFISTNMIMFKHIYTYWYYVAIINLLIWIGLSLLNVKKSNNAYIFLLSFTTITVYALIAASMDIVGDYFEINSPVVYIMVFAMIPVLLVYEGMSEQDRLLVVEKDLRQKEFFNAITDKLTGVWNQRYLAMLLTENLRHYTMALLDIDNFKEINDTYGHAVGDEILKAVADIIKKTIRKSDKVCRYGGDEFVIILVNSDIVEGYNLMEKVRQKISEFSMEHNGQSVQVTVSIGMDFDEGTKDLKDMFQDVDSRLYVAKKLGKNRVSYEDEVENL